jgi:hypothetical protein
VSGKLALASLPQPPDGPSDTDGEGYAPITTVVSLVPLPPMCR